MRALFSLPKSEESWVDEYSGQVRKAAPGQSAEHQGREFQSVASHRRVHYMEGSDDGHKKPQRPDSEEQRAEIIMPPRSVSQEFMKGASKFFGGNNFASEGSKLATINAALPAAPLRNIPLKQESLNSGATIHSTGEGLKQSASAGIGAKIKSRDAQPKPSESVQRQATSSLAATNEQKSRDRIYYDQITQRSVPSYTPIELEAKLNLREKSLSKDIVLDILMMKGHEPAQQTVATTELYDIATKLSMPVSAKTQQSIEFLTQALAEASEAPVDSSLLHERKAPRNSLLQLSSQKGIQDLKLAQEYSQEKAKGLSTDVIVALERATTQSLKDDPAEQLRLGTWAVHVLAGRMDTPAAELLRGMKKDAVLALGRLSMQLLSSSASAHTTFTTEQRKTQVSSSTTLRGKTIGSASAQVSTQAEHTTSQLPTASAKLNIETFQKSSIKGANEFFRMEAIQGDLQALQNNIQLEFTADMLVEGFIESLRNDDLDTSQEEMRSDILSQFGAKQTLQNSAREKDLSTTRATAGTFSLSASSSATPKQKHEAENDREAFAPLDFQGKRGHHQEKRKISFFPSVEVLASEDTEGAWSKPPESKYVE